MEFIECFDPDDLTQHRETFGFGSVQIKVGDVWHPASSKDRIDFARHLSFGRKFRKVYDTIDNDLLELWKSL